MPGDELHLSRNVCTYLSNLRISQLGWKMQRKNAGSQRFISHTGRKMAMILEDLSLLKRYINYFSC